ncbi:response regulator [Methylibium sp.]|uniref:response regulator n=1 Tax=Methylibium sp. TaxID=2067992 RepID=UPI003D14D294
MPRLLLLDDEPHVLAALKRTLRLGFGTELHIESTTDPRIALRRVAEAAFDLVVSDYRMPSMNGIEFLQRVRALQPHTVRIILSASSEVRTVMLAVNAVEVFRYLAKPWSDDELVVQVRQALRHAEQSRHDRELADAMKVQRGESTAAAAERRRLETIEPGITHVEWGPQGEVLMPDLADTIH